MSLLRSAAVFILSTLFIFSLYLAITSYSIGNLLDKGKLESFILSQLNESIAPQNCEEMCNTQFQQGCEGQCSNMNMTQSCVDACMNEPYNLEIKQGCIQTCLSRTNTSQEYLSQTIDQFYSRKIVANTSLDDIILILKNSILFIVFSLIFGIAIFFASEKPISKTGNNLIWVAISLLSMAVIPVFLVSSEMSVVKIISDYIMQSLYQQLFIGIILLVIGIILIYVGKKKNK